MYFKISLCFQHGCIRENNSCTLHQDNAQEPQSNKTRNICLDRKTMCVFGHSRVVVLPFPTTTQQVQCHSYVAVTTITYPSLSPPGRAVERKTEEKEHVINCRRNSRDKSEEAVQVELGSRGLGYGLIATSHPGLACHQPTHPLPRNTSSPPVCPPTLPPRTAPVPAKFTRSTGGSCRHSTNSFGPSTVVLTCRCQPALLTLR